MRRLDSNTKKRGRPSIPMTIEISKAELQRHIAGASAVVECGAEAFEIRADRDGGWCIQLHVDDSGAAGLARAASCGRSKENLGGSMISAAFAQRRLQQLRLTYVKAANTDS
jgi:hypothetical protein